MKIQEFFNRDLTEYRSIPFWSWNDELDPEELRREIRLMKEAGIGGFFMHARGGLTTEYLGDKWFEATGACIDEARKQGMDAWCYDENGWPSGFAGMKLLEDKNNWEHFIVCEKSPSFPAEALAVYILKDNELLRVKEPLEGAEEYIIILDKQNSSVVDILNRDIVRKFLDATHEKYYEHFPEDFGHPMMGFFTDEPQYFRWDTAYTPCILPEYEKEYGEDLLDSLGALFVDCKGAEKLRYRYWKLMSRLFVSSFAKQIYDWCEEHHCGLTGHGIEESSLFGQLMCCGEIMPFYQYEHKPGMDWLGRNISTEMAPRQVSSVSQQLGKKHVLTETFACAGWDVTPRELKRIAEWQYVHGVNQMCQHLYPYSIRGQRKRDYPAFYSTHNTWTQPEEFRHFNDYFTTLGTMLADSTEEAPVAVLHPIHSAWLKFDRNNPSTLDSLEESFRGLIEKLGAAHIGHHYIDETLFGEHGSVEGDTLVMGKCRYTAVILPAGMTTLDNFTAEALREYLANGGRLWMEGAAPTKIEGEEADLSFLKSNISYEDLLSGAVRVDKQTTEVRATLRHAPFGDFLFAVNLSENTDYDLTYFLKAKGVSRFDAEERKTLPIFFAKEDEGIAVPLHFAPGDSIILLLEDGAMPAEPVVAAEKEILLPTEGHILAMSENNLTLDTAELSLDGEHFSEPLPIMAISDRLLRGKTNQTVWLRYHFSVESLPETLRLECETMEARHIWVNGQKFLPCDAGTYDLAFVSGDILSLIREGENEILFEIDYYQSEEVYSVFNGVYYEHSDGTESLINCLSYLTDIEAIYLRGRFTVHSAPLQPGEKNTLKTVGAFALARPEENIDLSCVTEGGYPLFSGNLTVEIPFTATGKENTITLQGRFPLARLSINQSEEKTLMFTDKADVAGLVHEGENLLRLTVWSSFRNVFGPFHYAPEAEPMAVSPDLFSGYGKWREDGTSEEYNPEYALVRFGVEKMILR